MLPHELVTPCGCCGSWGTGRVQLPIHSRCLECKRDRVRITHHMTAPHSRWGSLRSEAEVDGKVLLSVWFQQHCGFWHEPLTSFLETKSFSQDKYAAGWGLLQLAMHLTYMPAALASNPSAGLKKRHAHVRAHIHNHTHTALSHTHILAPTTAHQISHRTQTRSLTETGDKRLFLSSQECHSPSLWPVLLHYGLSAQGETG